MCIDLLLWELIFDRGLSLFDFRTREYLHVTEDSRYSKLFNQMNPMVCSARTYCAFTALNHLKSIIDMTTNTRGRTVDPTGFCPIRTTMDSAMNLWFLEEERTSFEIRGFRDVYF